MLGMLAPLRRLGVCLLGGFVLIAVTGTEARSCGYDRCFGALALGPNGITARSSGQRTAPEAAERVERACGGQCNRIEVFHSGCAAMAQAPLGLPEFGFGSDRASAQGEALLYCRQNGGKGCRVRAWVCSS